MSLYEYILEHKDEEDFSLPKLMHGGVSFVDGALDGIRMDHMERKEVSEETKIELATALRSRDTEKLGRIAEKEMALALADTVSRIVIAAPEREYVGYAEDLMTKSDDRELVKIGIALCGQTKLDETKESDHRILEIIETLALCEEFTLYAVWVMQARGDNDGIFRLAKRTKGWGRDMAERWLEPKTFEIRQWFICHGACAYHPHTALNSWVKGDVPKRLCGDVTGEELRGIAGIIRGVMYDWLMEHLRASYDMEQCFAKFIGIVKRHFCAAEVYDTVQVLRSFYSREGKTDEALVKLCDEVLNSLKCRLTMKAAQRKGKPAQPESAPEPEKEPAEEDVPISESEEEPSEEAEEVPEEKEAGQEEKKYMIFYDTEDTKKIARAEKFIAPGDTAMFENSYRITLEDVLAALGRVMNGEVEPRELYEKYVLPVGVFYEKVFELDDIRNKADKEDEFFDLTVSEEGHIGLFFRHYGDGISDDKEQTLYYCKRLYDRLSRGLANRGKEIEDMEFADGDKEQYIVCFEKESNRQKASERALKLCVRYIEELCGKKYLKALEMKAYAAYEGNELYPQDWFVARDCLEELLELTGDPNPANSLGYIYCYGRCNNGVPEYEKAFANFSLAAACGLYQGMYKLGDLYLHGHGCRKSEQAAYNLYRMVYDDCISITGFDERGQFADAALRLGNCYLDGRYRSKNPGVAYYYFLQAKYAIDRRLRFEEYGDRSVLMNICDGLKRAKEQLPPYYFRNYLNYADDYLFKLFTNAGTSILHMEKKDDETLELTLSREEKDAAPLFLTFPQLNLCGMKSKLKFTAEKVEGYVLKEGDTAIDDTAYEKEGNAVIFYYRGEEVGWIRCEAYRQQGTGASADVGERYLMVSVMFEGSMKLYDYVCNIEDVKEGDRVVVYSGGKRSIVTVKRVYTAAKSELPLPFHLYKLIYERE